MKRFKYLAYILFVVITTVLIIVIYDNVSKGESEKSGKEKVLSEVQFLQGKIETLINKMNNIETRNYNISISKITKQSEEIRNTTNSNEGKEETGSSSSFGGSSSLNSSQNSSSSSSEQQENTNKKYKMVQTGVLLDSRDVDWSNVKSEIEILYSSIPTITLDLSQENISQEDILNFNKEFDNLAKAVKSENKEETLKELAIVYEYMPKFIEKSTDDDVTNKLARTKAHIYNAYSKLDSKDWKQIENEAQEAVNIYSELLSNTNIGGNKQYNISKIYIMLNEFKNSVNIKDETIFLIKYKNLIEGMNNL